jgi:hypothetical protein
VGGSALAGVVFLAVWTLVSRGPDVAAVKARALPPSVVDHLARYIATQRVPFYLNQVVGQFGYGEITISRYAIVLWYLLWAALVVPALIWGGWRLRLILVGICGFCLAALVALDWHFAPLNGWFAHGRYALPTAVGVVLLAAACPSGPARWIGARWLPVALVTLTAPVHLYALARTMNRFERGLDAPLNPFAGTWRPVGGPALALAVAAVGVTILALLVSNTERYVSPLAVTTTGMLDNGSVTPTGRRAPSPAQASTTDATSH